MPFSKKNIFNSRGNRHLGELWRGYSLIELLVVIAIFGITITLVTASYLTFERNQRFRSASNQLKNDIRFAQNKALAGDKSSTKCQIPGYTLAGWYVNLSVSTTGSYYINSDCKNSSGVEDTDNPVYKTYQLPKGVEICNISDGIDRTDVYIFYQTLLASPSVHASSASVPPFFDSGGNLKTTINTPLQIYLKNTSTVCNQTGTYKVVILSTGEVNEVKL